MPLIKWAAVGRIVWIVAHHALSCTLPRRVETELAGNPHAAGVNGARGASPGQVLHGFEALGAQLLGDVVLLFLGERGRFGS